MELKIERTAGTKSTYKYIGVPENLQKLRKEASDPIEEENVYVASSEIPEGGEGLFAKKVIGTFHQILNYRKIANRTRTLIEPALELYPPK